MAFDQYVSGETSKQIQDFSDDAGKSASDLAKMTLAGTEDSRRMLAPDTNFESGIGFSNDALSEAINRKYKQRYGQEMKKLNTTVGYDSVNRKFDRLAQAAQLVDAEAKHNDAVRQAEYQRRQNKKLLRGQLIGNILGIGGAIAGATIGSAAGPAGTLAGMQIGSSLGQGAGGFVGSQ